MQNKTSIWNVIIVNKSFRKSCQAFLTFPSHQASQKKFKKAFQLLALLKLSFKNMLNSALNS